MCSHMRESKEKKMTCGSNYANWSLQNTSQNKVTKELFYNVAHQNNNNIWYITNDN